MTAQHHHTAKSLVTIKDIRDALKPLISCDPFLATLDKQLKGYAKGDDDDNQRSARRSKRTSEE